MNYEWALIIHDTLEEISKQKLFSSNEVNNIDMKLDSSYIITHNLLSYLLDLSQKISKI